MPKSAKWIILAFAPLLLVGCMSAQEHKAAVQNEQGDRLTVGKVQREIRVGMAGGEVAAVLGSPNIVSTDEKGREVWIYDKIATDRVYSTSSGGVSALILGGALVGSAGLAGGAAVPSYSSGAGASSTNQRTLTIIIKYDENKKVRDFAYHSSSF